MQASGDQPPAPDRIHFACLKWLSLCVNGFRPLCTGVPKQAGGQNGLKSFIWGCCKEWVVCLITGWRLVQETQRL